MNSHERVTRTLLRQGPDRIAAYDGLWEDTHSRWIGEGMPADVSPTDYFGFDIDFMYVDASPRMEQCVLAQDADYITYRDRAGYTVKKSVGKSRTMHFMDHVTTDKAAWEQIRRRLVLDLSDTARLDDASYFMHLDPFPTWEEAAARFARVRARERYLLFVGYGAYEATWRHRGFDRFLMDMAEDPAWAAEMAAAYMDLLLDVLRESVRRGMRPDGFFMVDDLAYTRGMLMSPRTWRRIFQPQVARLGQFLRQEGITFWMHCCGNAEAVFGDLIDCGLQVIQPLEAKSGLDVRVLRKTYGQKLTFWGNIDVINMARGSDAEVEEEVRSKLEAFRDDGGGYIYHSDHSVPPEVSLPRYLQVMKWVRQYGTYS